MNRLKFISAILIIFFVNSSFSQDTIIKNSQKLKIDCLGNIYLIEKNNFSVISKGTKKEYQNNYLGNIFSADVSNPLRILIFHKEANQIVFLNNELSIIGEAINLDEIGLPDISVICSSQINGFWLYNNLNNRIEFFNQNLNKIHSSINLSQFIESSNDVQEIKMKDKKVYLKTKNTGILVFDMFGTYIKTLPIKSSTSFQILENAILYTKSNQVIVYDFQKLDSFIIYQSQTPIRYARINDNKLFVLENEKLSSLNITPQVK